MRIIRFGIVGVANSMIDFVLFYILSTHFGWNIFVANAAAYSIAVMNSFIWNKRWTFRAHDTGRRAIHDFSLFTGGNLIGLGLSTGVIMGASLILPSWVGKLLAISVGFPWNYWYNRKFVYKGERNHGDQGQIRTSDVVDHCANVQ